MRGLPYYEYPEYHDYLLSSQRREMFPVRDIFSQISFSGTENLLDFGCGNGYFLPGFQEVLPAGAEIWGAECQEVLIDQCLKLKVQEGWQNFIPFYMERTEHPLLPDWIPYMDLIFCSCVLSTFADPTLALKGLGRALTQNGKMIILDWHRTDAPSGPEKNLKVSRERMQYFIEDAGYTVTGDLSMNPYVYGIAVRPDPERFDPGTYYVVQ